MFEASTILGEFLNTRDLLIFFATVWKWFAIVFFQDIFLTFQSSL